MIKELMKVIRRRKKRGVLLILFIILLAAYIAWALLRPLPYIQPDKTSKTISINTPPSSLVWPTSQAAVGILDSNIEETKGEQTPVPTASTAKVITALVVLDKKPLALKKPGPKITFNGDDMASFSKYLAQDGSVLPVKSGEQITEYQALQAMLLPSANNIADTLAIWAFGSIDDYSKAANEYLANYGFKQTKVGDDASGLLPETTSTALELMKIGKLAMGNPIIAQIVSQSEASGIPQVDKIKNTNYLLGSDGIVGIKTGHSDQAGGVFIGAAKVKVNGQTKTIVTAVMKAPDRSTAMKQSLALIRSAEANFKPLTLIKKGSVVGSYLQPWGGKINAIATKDLKLSVWNGTAAKSTIKIRAIKPETNSGKIVGSISSENEKISIKLQTKTAKPSFWWLIVHPIGS